MGYSSATGLAANTVTLSTTLTGGTLANGYLELLYIIQNSNADHSTITVGNGFTFITQGPTLGANTVECYLYWKLASSEPASYTLGGNVANNLSAPDALLRVYSHVSAAPIDSSSENGTASANTITVPSTAATAINNELEVAFAGNNGVTMPNPASLTNYVTFSGDWFDGMGDLAIPTAGTTPAAITWNPAGGTTAVCGTTVTVIP